MLKLINVGSYQTEGSIYSASTMSIRLVDAINNNSDVFSATYSSGYTFNITCDDDETKSAVTLTAGFASTGIASCGYVVAIDDEKMFLMILPRVILNTKGDATIDLIGSIPKNADSGRIMIGAIAKDSNKELCSIAYMNSSLYGGLSVYLDIGQKGSDEFTSEGDFILRQGAIRNHIVPELFFSMTRLGSCGDILEKDGHQYTCIAGPIFYQIS